MTRPLLNQPEPQTGQGPHQCEADLEQAILRDEEEREEAMVEARQRVALQKQAIRRFDVCWEIARTVGDLVDAVIGRKKAVEQLNKIIWVAEENDRARRAAIQKKLKALRTMRLNLVVQVDNDKVACTPSKPASCSTESAHSVQTSQNIQRPKVDDSSRASPLGDVQSQPGLEKAAPKSHGSSEAAVPQHSSSLSKSPTKRQTTEQNAVRTGSRKKEIAKVQGASKGKLPVTAQRTLSDKAKEGKGGGEVCESTKSASHPTAPTQGSQNPSKTHERDNATNTTSLSDRQSLPKTLYSEKAACQPHVQSVPIAPQLLSPPPSPSRSQRIVKRDAGERECQDNSVKEKRNAGEKIALSSASEEVTKEKEVCSPSNLAGCPTTTTHDAKGPMQTTKFSTSPSKDQRSRPEVEEAACNPHDLSPAAELQLSSPISSTPSKDQNPKKDAVKDKDEEKGRDSPCGGAKEVEKDIEEVRDFGGEPASYSTVPTHDAVSRPLNADKFDTDSCPDAAPLDDEQHCPKTEKAACGSRNPNSATLETPQVSPPPTPSMWDLFISSRPHLLQEAIRDSVRTGTFNNVEIYTHRKRGKVPGFACVPAVVHGRASFLEAASPVLKDLLVTGKRQLRNIPSANYNYEYLDDSDLEDEPEDSPIPLAEKALDEIDDISDVMSVPSVFDVVDSPQHTIGTVDEPQPPTPNVTHEASTATDLVEPLAREVVYVPFGATRTWQALMIYLYYGNISFCPLESQCSVKNQDDVSCSPKSMYFLAKKLELAKLAKVCEEAIIKVLSPSNIVKELFSDFTWRSPTYISYPEILSQEVALFMRHSQDRHVRSDLKQAFEDTASGKFPHRDAVLSALFDGVIPPASSETSNVY
ncbi:hypothetical protein BDY19DRAFT_997046 [Irpex rosettiformis]|uniref:Uncharacterized protein n=1 Tax=Irpex rosettiformis TaxID=378272 RepID=A0ACB8TSZ2_9APHY|nr:hypothetical protein BDY19DRAFT_997046 [Irpex rosettiformis]